MRHVERRLAAILVADIAGYSRLMAEDDTATVTSLKGHQAIVLPLVEAHGGRIRTRLVTAFLAEFGASSGHGMRYRHPAHDG